MKKPTKAAIAKALGVSPAAATRYFRRGCPTYSIEAARAWQAQHVDPTQRATRLLEAASAPASGPFDVEAAFAHGARVGGRVALDYALLQSQPVFAAALLRFGELPLATAMRLATLGALAVHAVARQVLRLEDAAVNAVPGAIRVDLAKQLAELDQQAMAANAEVLAHELFAQAGAE